LAYATDLWIKWTARCGECIFIGRFALLVQINMYFVSLSLSVAPYKVGCKDMSHGEKKHDKISKPQVRFLGTVVNVEDLTIRMLRKPCPSGECLL